MRFQEYHRGPPRRILPYHYGNTIAATETLPNPYRFIGSEWDSQTGLYKMGERYYDPSIGRFTQLDPLGAGYVYATNDPVNIVDHSGLGGDGLALNLPDGGGSSEIGLGDGGDGEGSGEGSRETRGEQKAERTRGLAPEGIKPPGYDESTWSTKEASRDSEKAKGGMSYYDPGGGE